MQMARLIIHLWFPYLAADRLRRCGEVRAEQTLVLIRKYQAADYVDALCPQAQRRGLRVGMRLADARALCPDLVSRDANPLDDARDLQNLALWARRYCPLTAPDYGNAGMTDGAGVLAATAIAKDGHGIWLDVAGADHLYGGLRSLLADMLWRLHRARVHARLGVASTCGAAWGLARYGTRYGARYATRYELGEGGASPRRLGALLAPLPLAALRIEGATCTAMAAAGLRVIGDILGMPRAPLANRFGARLIERLDAALGYVNESFSPIAPPRPLLAIRHFAEPIAAPDDIKAVIHKLAEEIAQILAENGLATRRLQLGWQRVDGTIFAHDTHLSRPSRDAAAFHRLLADASEAVDPEFGLESTWMEAHGCSPQMPVSKQFTEGLTAAETYASLVDRLVARLGYGAVLRVQSRPCWQPETAQYMVLPNIDVPNIDMPNMDVPNMWAPRPIRLLAHPQPLSVVALLPDHPPAQFIWQKKTHRISQASGPERIAPQWWTASPGTKTRDYFRLQDETGARFWVYREGLPERGEDVSWFLHGFFT